MAAVKPVLPPPGAARHSAAPAAARQVPKAKDLLCALWSSPIPATLQDAGFRLLDVNEAYATLLGLPREQLVGHDPVELQPAEDRAGRLATPPAPGFRAAPRQA